MSAPSPSRPRSIALVGPYAAGKSALFDALMDAAGCPPKRGETRRMGTDLRLGHCTYLGDAWSVLDCPGSVEFAYAACCAIAVVDLAVVVCEPDVAKAPAAGPLLRMLAEQHVPHMVFVNKIDAYDGHVRDVLAALQAQTKLPLVLRQVPLREGGHITGYVDVVSERAYRYRPGQASELIELPAAIREREQEVREKLLETLADHDDALMEKILEDVTVSRDEIYAQLGKDSAQGVVTETLLGAAESRAGVRRLWKALRHEVPAAAQTAERRGIAPGGEPLVQVFRTQYAGHAGKLSFARIWRGPLKDGATLNGTRVGGIHRMPGGEDAKVPQAETGELVALGRLDQVVTGATLGGDALPFPAPPAPVYALAISTKDRAEDVKLSGALQKLVEEDPSLSVTHEQDLGQTVLHGQGEMHLNAAIERIKGFGLTLSTARPAVGYRETIRHAVHQHGRLKRQTGGHGQFADVKIDIAPRARGEGFLFTDKIVGGAVPRQYIPAVAEAAEDAAKKGPFGFPVVDIAVTLVDGTFHSVDSSDMAFKTATRMAMQEGLVKADPVLLEPIDRVTISVPNEFTARAQRLLTGRRGQILGYAERPAWAGWDDVEALVPEAELHDLIIELRSQTLGLGTYRRKFDHLAESRAEAKRGAA